MARPKKKAKPAAPLRVGQFGMMLDAYFGSSINAGLRKTKGEKKIAGTMERARELSASAEEVRLGFAEKLRIMGDGEGAAAVEGGMDKKEWGKFWTRERVEAFRKSRRK
jgi:hypothetical protein